MAKKTAKKELSEEALALLAEKLSAMGEPWRLRILNLLCCRGELNVSELVQLCGGHQSNVSRHLARLLSAGLVARRKSGVQIYYSLADDSLPVVCECLCKSLKKQISKLSATFAE